MATQKFSSLKCRYALLSVAAATLVFLPGIAGAQSCNSAAKVTAAVFDKVGTVAVAAGCETVKVALSDDHQFDAKDLLACYQKASFATGLADMMTGWWNKMVADQSTTWSTLGPRRLDMNKDNDGTLEGTGGRMFVAAVPFRTDSATVTISERDGKGKASAVVCLHEPDGKAREVKTVWFNDTDTRKDNESETRTVELTGVKGLLPSIHLDGKSFSNKLSYTLRVDTD